jgi:hypothetical protein
VHGEDGETTSGGKCLRNSAITPQRVQASFSFCFRLLVVLLCMRVWGFVSDTCLESLRLEKSWDLTACSVREAFAVVLELLFLFFLFLYIYIYTRARADT